MNHKRGRAKNRRAGCLLCKPHKGNGLKGRTAHQSLQERQAREAERAAVDEWSVHQAEVRGHAAAHDS